MYAQVKLGIECAPDLLDGKHRLGHEGVVAGEGNTVPAENEEQPEHRPSEFLASDREIEILPEREGDFLFHHPLVNQRIRWRQRGGDFEILGGQDWSIGYLNHDAESVELYLEETFTSLVNTPAAAVRFDFAG